MAYQTYTTEAIVCGRTVRGEHDLTLRLYTKDTGMIFARAGAARALESKLRYGLQDFSYSRITLVHGKHEWRVTGATLIENLYYRTASREHRGALRNATRVVRRLLSGTAAEPDLFAIVIEGLQTLAEGDGSQAATDVFLLRVLHHLGYVPTRAAYADLVGQRTLKDAHALLVAGPERSGEVARAVETALTASHL